MNERIFINVDQIHLAIGNNLQIRFQYFQWNVKKEMELRHDGVFYEVSPWALSWDDENYYLVAYDSDAEKIKHFRVDKMLNVTAIADKREGRATFRDFDMAVYAKKMFGMYDGEEREVKLLCENRLAGVMIDRFGKSVKMKREDDNHFTVSVKVAVSSQFFGWVFALGSGVTIIAPNEVVEQIKAEVERLSKQYL